jgi:phthiocerol/phenolphthiocerol synthesis type-I polyketide synthase E
MNPFSKRMSRLSPQRRQLFEKLVSQHAESRPATPPTKSSTAGGPQPVLSYAGEDKTGVDHSPTGSKAMYKHFYDAVSTQLDATMFGEFSHFLNYGYVADLSPQHSRVELPKHYFNRNSVKLVLELIGDCPLAGRRVLDVGCGRGGTAHALTTFFSPATVVGLDLSPVAVAFCRRVHRDSRLRFADGDAEQMPFADGSFDVVTNIESSHSYPNICFFFAEVRRVLVPGGHFLYTDVVPVEKKQECMRFLQELGFLLQRDRDITSNVLLSCDEIARTRLSAFDSGNDPELMANFLAVPGSEVYDSMRERKWTYNLARWLKPE